MSELLMTIINKWHCGSDPITHDEVKVLIDSYYEYKERAEKAESRVKEIDIKLGIAEACLEEGCGYGDYEDCLEEHRVKLKQPA